MLTVPAYLITYSSYAAAIVDPFHPAHGMNLLVVVVLSVLACHGRKARRCFAPSRSYLVGGDATTST